VVKLQIVSVDCPRNVKIDDVANDSKIDGGTVLRCSARGNPSPTIRWTNLTGGVDVTGSTFTVEANTFYVLTCTATNNITHSDGRQQTCSDSYTVTFNSKLFVIHCMNINFIVVSKMNTSFHQISLSFH